MAYQQQQGAGDFVLHALASTLGAVIGLVVGGVVFIVVGAFKLLSYAAKTLIGAAKTSQITQPTSASETAGTSEESTNNGVIPDLPPDALWNTRFDDVSRKRVELGKAHVDIWFYPKLGIARRTMRICNVKMAKKFGSRIKLADLPLDASNALEVELQTITEAEQFIAEALKTKEPSEIKPVKPVSSASPSVSNPDNTQQDLLLVETPKVAESEPVQKVAPAERQPRKREVTYRGVLEGHGVGPHKDAASGGTYQCFSLSLYDFALGSVHDIIGTDLERAIKESGAVVGDSVEVSLVGDIKTPYGKGKFRTKKIWHVTKIDQKS